MTTDPLVVFTPSGKRGHFPVGTPVLTAARQLGRRSGFGLWWAWDLLEMSDHAQLW